MSNHDKAICMSKTCNKSSSLTFIVTAIVAAIVLVACGSGSDGLAGSAGAAGNTGEAGAAGSTGATGATGTNGSNGANGVAGANGINGVDGATGTAGSNGSNGTNGSNGSNGNSSAIEICIVPATSISSISLCGDKTTGASTLIQTGKDANNDGLPDDPAGITSSVLFCGAGSSGAVIQNPTLTNPISGLPERITCSTIR
jgi:Collagen triple helix repeat (20 copies)